MNPPRILEAVLLGASVPDPGGYAYPTIRPWGLRVVSTGEVVAGRYASKSAASAAANRANRIAAQ